MDHFALPNDELSVAQREGHLQRNFQGYSTKAECDLIGLGVSAIGKISDCYAQNLKEIPHWSAAVSEGALPVWRGLGLSTEDRLRRSIIESIMCHGRVDFARFEAAYDLDFSEHFAPEIHQLEIQAEDGLLELDEEGFVVTSEGRLLLRAVAMVFDEYLQTASMQPRFSRVI